MSKRLTKAGNPFSVKSQASQALCSHRISIRQTQINTERPLLRDAFLNTVEFWNTFSMSQKSIGYCVYL